LREFGREKNIDFAWVQVVGELVDGKVASGYYSEDFSEGKFMNPVDENRHVLGVGSLTEGEEGYSVHVHGPQGREGSTLTGCWGADPSVFRGVEILLAEFQ
jgi:predicted DNA-binding protein with PD1-like motif